MLADDGHRDRQPKLLILVHRDVAETDHALHRMRQRNMDVAGLGQQVKDLTRTLRQPGGRRWRSRWTMASASMGGMVAAARKQAPAPPAFPDAGPATGGR